MKELNRKVSNEVRRLHKLMINVTVRQSLSSFRTCCDLTDNQRMNLICSLFRLRSGFLS